MTTKTLDDVLLHLREMSHNTREQGEYFERLIRRVLLISPWFDNEFSDVWLWRDWPDRKGKGDTGIDIVAKEKDTGDLVAVQCKFYEEGHYLDKGQIDSFFASLGQQPFAKGMIFSTTDNWSKNAEALLDNPTKPVNRVRVQDLRDAGIDWSSFVVEDPERTMQRTGRKHLRPHQREAVDDVINGFMTSHRGQMIMACGTGKTFTSLKLVEEMVPAGGNVLFLVPSISLLQQTLTEWKAESERDMRFYAVCSDISVGRKIDDTNEIHPYDLIIPATTDPAKLDGRARGLPAKDLTVIFSTYQSISRVSTAQKHNGSGLTEFDLVICDEAHRTTGVAMSGEDPSEFMKVHDNGIIQAKKRLYMTATPRIYDEQSQRKAEENDYLVASMDDVETLRPGVPSPRLRFAPSSMDLLTDYKVLILTVSETMLQHSIDLDDPEIEEVSLDDAVKIIGCWNGLAKRDNPANTTNEFAEDVEPMRRAVAFSRSIKDSKHITNYFPKSRQRVHRRDPGALRHPRRGQSRRRQGQRPAPLSDAGLAEAGRARKTTTSAASSPMPAASVRASMSRPSIPSFSSTRAIPSWTSSSRSDASCASPPARSTATSSFRSPSLRTSRREEALNDNKNYKVVWQVLQALRAHDDRFNAMINKIELNKRRPPQIDIIGVGGGKEKGGDDGSPSDGGEDVVGQIALDLQFFEQWREAIYARIVDKVGDRRYWDSWAKDIADIADTHIVRMHKLLEDPSSEPSKAFDTFLDRLHEEINPAVTRDEAIEMLAQHLITRPVFEALFTGSGFVDQNPVSCAMQEMLDALGEQQLGEERKTLERFYRSVQQRAAGIDNAEGRQKVVIELYDKFFRNAFPKMADRLGIVYTPVEVVDYLLHSADWVLRKHFGKGLTDEGVHVLDPFTGTGTFITRLLQSGLIRPEDAEREVHQRAACERAGPAGLLHRRREHRDGLPGGVRRGVPPVRGHRLDRYLPDERERAGVRDRRRRPVQDHGVEQLCKQ